jgi:hypothetical protein
MAVQKDDFEMAFCEDVPIIKVEEERQILKNTVLFKRQKTLQAGPSLMGNV